MADITADAIQKIVSLATPQVVVSSLPGGLPSVLVPEEFTLEVLKTNEDYAQGPRRIKGTVKVFDPASFVRYFEDFKDSYSRIFADETVPTIQAVLDYHEDGTTAVPRWCQHRVQLCLRKSEEWSLWTTLNAKRMTQEDFARFLEDNSPDLEEPAKMIEVARSLSAKTEMTFESSVRTNSGAKFKYNEVVKATGGIGPAGELEVPDTFGLRIPVYLGTPLVTLRARLRFQITGGKLAMWYDLWRAAEAERRAFGDVRQSISDATEVQILNGAPPQ